MFAYRGQPGPAITRDLVSRLPYASISGKIGRGPRSLLVLAEIVNGELVFSSADNASFHFRSGRLTRTTGLLKNLRRTAFLDPDPLPAMLTANAPRELRRLADFDPMERYDVMLRSRFEIGAAQRIEIAELAFDTVVVTESVHSPDMDWKHENRYWLDATSGAVWKSIQHFYPGVAPIEIEILKPAAA